MRGQSEAQSRYLSLALSARRVINSLRPVAAGQHVGQELDVSLSGLLAGLAWEHEASFATHLQASGAWTSFEELSTLAELRSEVNMADIDQLLMSVLQPGSAPDKSVYAKRLIAFFGAVEGRALQRYTDAMQMQTA